MKRLFLPMVFAVNAAAQVPGELRGRVLESDDHRPVAGARVEVVGKADVVTSRADGVFVIRGLEPRAYTLRVRAIGHAERTIEMEVVNGRTESIDVLLDRVAESLAAVRVSTLRDVPGATTFDRRAIETSGARDLAELIQTTPGVTVTRSGGPGAPARASIRGSAAAQVLVLLDGVPVNSALTGEADLSQIPLENAERVTVRAGSQSSRFGARALAGVIEVETRTTRPEVAMTLRGGAFGERNGSLIVGASRDALSASILADVRDVRGDFVYDVPAFRGGGRARRTNSDLSARELSANVGLARERVGIGARASGQTLDRGMANTIVQPSSTGHQESDRAGGRLDAWAQIARVRVDAAVDVAHEKTAFTDPAPPLGGSYHDTTTADAVTSTLTARSGLHFVEFSAGAESRRTKIASTTLDASAPDHQTIRSGWISAEADREFSGTRFIASAAARVDRSSLDNATVTSPKVGLQALRGRWTASASVGSGYAPPTLTDQFFREGVQVQANPDLRAERTQNELEGRIAVHDVQFGPTTSRLELAVFRADIDGMILWQPDFRFIWSPSNFDVRRRGWEIAGSVDVHSHFSLNGSLNDARIEYAGPVLSGQVAYRPRTTGHITAAGTMRRVRTEITTRYIGERRTVTGSPLNVLDSYTLTDVRISTDAQRDRWFVGLTLGIDNVFNQSAAMLVDYPFPGRAWSLVARVRRKISSAS